jgi:hypothetical protein
LIQPASDRGAVARLDREEIRQIARPHGRGRDDDPRRGAHRRTPADQRRRDGDGDRLQCCSAGVAALPGTGQQIYYSTSLVGSSLFGGSDVSIFNLRYGESDEFTTAQLTWDLRLPIGRRLRLNPRLRLGVWEGTLTGRTRERITPSLRLLWNSTRHYRLELEVGEDSMTRTDSGGEQDATGRFFNLGYRADF